MATIADANAITEPKKIWTQHQTVLSIIQGRIAIPNISNFRWLDLCCGLGQVITNLEENFNSGTRNKIEYSCQDIKEEYIKATQKKAEGLDFKKVTTYTTDVAIFHSIVPTTPPFDFITIINAFHEINPFALSSIVYEAIIRLEVEGTLYVFDMESIKPYELGAIPWSREEMFIFLNEFLKPVMIDHVELGVNKWRHSSTSSWSVELKRQMFKSQEELLNNKTSLIDEGKNVIIRLLKEKLKTCEKMLESITKFGTTTPEDQENKLSLLYQHYSIHRQLKTV